MFKSIANKWCANEWRPQDIVFYFSFILVSTFSIFLLTSVLGPSDAAAGRCGSLPQYQDGSGDSYCTDASGTLIYDNPVVGTVPSVPATEGLNEATSRAIDQAEKEYQSGSGGAADGETQTQCDSAAKTASSACLLPGIDGMEAGEAAMYTMMINQMTTLGSQIASVGKNMSEQCRVQADIAKIAGMINGIKAAACGVTISKCTSTCEEEISDFTQKAQDYPVNSEVAVNYRKLASKAKKKMAMCSSFKAQVVTMGMGAAQHAANFAQANQCAKDTAATNSPTPTLPPPPDCSDPSNQSLACYCARPGANQQYCQGTGGRPPGGVGAAPSGPPNGTVVKPTNPGLGLEDSEGEATTPVLPQQRPGNDNGFQAGGAGAPGAGGLGAFGSEDGGYGQPGDPKNMITGTSGNSGGGISAGGGGGGGGGLAGRGGGGSGDGNGFLDKFNLKKFLPGSNYKARGLAGKSVKAVDGITGPTGPSIWEKATRQYQEQSQSGHFISDR